MANPIFSDRPADPADYMPPVDTLFLDRSPCGICGEPIRWSDPRCEAAEMYDPADPEKDSVVCHAECGIAAGLEVA